MCVAQRELHDELHSIRVDVVCFDGAVVQVDEFVDQVEAYARACVGRWCGGLVEALEDVWYVFCVYL